METEQNEKPAMKYFILARDVDLAPTDLVPEGSLVTRLHGLLADDAPATLEFTPNQISLLIQLAPELQPKPQLIMTDSLKELPGVRLLSDVYLTIPADTAENQLKDYVHDRMQSEQGPAQEFERLMKESKKSMAPYEVPLQSLKPKTPIGDDDEEAKL